MFLCADAGTTKLKAALMDIRGNILAYADAALTVLRPFHGAAEMDMDGLYKAFCTATQKLQKENPKAMAALQGVGICAQGDGLWPLDKGGRPVGNAILWNDSRAGALGVERDEALSAYVENCNSTALYVGAFPVILGWMKENAPREYGRIAYALHCKDWLNYRLTGEIASDYSDQSAAGIDIFSKRYAEGIFERLSIGDCIHMLPPLFESSHILGAITVEAERETGIPRNTPVILGCMDVAAMAAGAMARAGDGCAILGTTLCNLVLLERKQVNLKDRNGSTLCSALPEKYNRVMAASSGTAALDWARKAILPEMGIKELEAGMESLPPGSEGVLFHPYIAGERAPFREPAACSGFYGLRAEHTPMHMMRAAYEGVALSMADCFLTLPEVSGNLYVSGGGARSDFLCQLAADTLGREIIRHKGQELGLTGIWRVLLRGLHIDAPKTSEEGMAFVPRPLVHEAMAESYVSFKSLQAAMLPFWRNSMGSKNIKRKNKGE